MPEMNMQKATLNMPPLAPGGVIMTTDAIQLTQYLAASTQCLGKITYRPCSIDFISFNL